MQIEILSKVNSVVLLTGESGTGKTNLAKKIHQLSTRKDKPFIRINLATLNKNLIESELFGHVRGAFTGSLQEKLSPLELVKKGTLFLDEIGELELPLQAKLLDLIERKTYYKVGSTQESFFEGTIIAATNKNIGLEVDNKNFREDLYYRLRIFHYELSPFRENIDKMGIILDQISRRHLNLPKSVVKVLFDYSWPGNYRELLNTFELIEEISRLKEFDIFCLPKWLFENERKNHESEYKKALEQFEKCFIADKLNDNQGNITQTAKALKMSKSMLNNKLRKFELLQGNF